MHHDLTIIFIRLYETLELRVCERTDIVEYVYRTTLPFVSFDAELKSQVYKL
jgi:hypothetical protein